MAKYAYGKRIVPKVIRSLHWTIRFFSVFFLSLHYLWRSRIAGESIRTHWKWHRDVCWSDTRLPCYVCLAHRLCKTTIFSWARRKMVKCALGIWLTANARKMSNCHKCTRVFRPTTCPTVMIFACFAMDIMQRFWWWIHSVWKFCFRWARKWSRTGYRRCMWDTYMKWYLWRRGADKLFCLCRCCGHRNARTTSFWPSQPLGRWRCGLCSATRTSIQIRSTRTNRNRWALQWKHARPANTLYFSEFCSRFDAWMPSVWIAARKINEPCSLCAQSTGKFMMPATLPYCAVSFRRRANVGWVAIFSHTIASFCGRTRAKVICTVYRQSKFAHLITFNFIHTSAFRHTHTLVQYFAFAFKPS